MKTRDVQIDLEGFKPRVDPKKDEKSSATPPKNPFDELNSDKYKSKNPFYVDPTAAEKLDLADKASKETKEDKVEPTEVEKPVSIPAGEYPVAKESIELGEEWIRQELPSNCLPYDFSEVYIRPLKVRALGMIYAAHVNKSFSLLLDALNPYINVDIRELTPQDLTFIMHWLRGNSYPKSPMKIKYRTRYGNDVEIPVKVSNLKITDLEMTKDEYKSWKAKGIVFPTVRDMELLFGDDISADVRFNLEYAQYVGIEKPETYADYVDLKLDKLDELGIGIIPIIDEFSELTDHGIEESITFSDPKFDPLKAADYFDTQVSNMLETLKRIPEEDRDRMTNSILDIGQAAEELANEALELREAVERGEKPVAKEEVVAIRLEATDFFSNL